MTNADYYLKDGVNKDKFIYEIAKLFNNWGEKEQKEYLSLTSYVTEWVNKTIKPTLTEDEKVILRNLPHNEKIARTSINGDLYIETYDKKQTWLIPFNHLFQFIKNGEEYSIEELLK